MTSPTRLRVVTPERLDALVANLVNTGGSATGTAVATKAGTGTPTTTGVVTATANSLMQRDASARAQIANPAVGADIANKSYVDTAIATTVLSSTRGAASGVATLDGSALIPVAQIPTTYGRHLGSGTAFPGSHNTGDTYIHTGLGSALFRWSGAGWEQQSRATCASRTARNTMMTTYGAVMPIGFTVVQTDMRWKWRNDEAGWILAGFDGDGSWASTTGNVGPTFMYQTVNQPIIHGASTAILKNWTYHQQGTVDTEREVITYNGSNGLFNINDRCLLAITMSCSSDAGVAGSTRVYLYPPGGNLAFPTGALSSKDHRMSGYAGAGYMEQTLTWIGYGDPGQSFSVGVDQYNTSSSTVNYAGNIGVSILSA